MSRIIRSLLFAAVVISAPLGPAAAQTEEEALAADLAALAADDARLTEFVTGWDDFIVPTTHVPVYVGFYAKFFGEPDLPGYILSRFEREPAEEIIAFLKRINGGLTSQLMLGGFARLDPDRVGVFLIDLMIDLLDWAAAKHPEMCSLFAVGLTVEEESMADLVLAYLDVLGPSESQQVFDFAFVAMEAELNGKASTQTIMPTEEQIEAVQTELATAVAARLATLENPAEVLAATTGEVDDPVAYCEFAQLLLGALGDLDEPEFAWAIQTFVGQAFGTTDAPN